MAFPGMTIVVQDSMLAGNPKNADAVSLGKGGLVINLQTHCDIKYMCYSAIQSLYRHMVCNVPVSRKANGDRNQLAK